MSWTEDEVNAIDQIETPQYLNILPDSRTKAEPKATMRGWHPLFGMIEWQPVYCANCGVFDGLYPTENIDFAFCLCPKCAEQWGALAGTMLCPDQVYWQRVEQYQIEKYGHVLPRPDLLRLIETDSDRQLALLLKENPAIKGGR